MPSDISGEVFGAHGGFFADQRIKVPALIANAKLRDVDDADVQAIVIDAPSIILDGRLLANTGRTYDVSRDGDRFLLLKDHAAVDRSASRPGIIVVQNWFRELNEKLPIAR